jgi:hypothetical protein
VLCAGNQPKILTLLMAVQRSSQQQLGGYITWYVPWHTKSNDTVSRWKCETSFFLPQSMLRDRQIEDSWGLWIGRTLCVLTAFAALCGLTLFACTGISEAIKSQLFLVTRSGSWCPYKHCKYILKFAKDMCFWCIWEVLQMHIHKKYEECDPIASCAHCVRLRLVYTLHKACITYHCR